MAILEATNLRKSFGPPNKRVEAVRGVSLHINAGEILAFLGRNGAGKTTTIKMIAGLLSPDAGAVTINGRSPHPVTSFLGELAAAITTPLALIARSLSPARRAGQNSSRDGSVFSQIGSVFEGSRNLYLQLTAMDNLLYFGATKGLTRRQCEARAIELLRLFDLEHKANSRVRELSRGMQQKLSIAVSIVHRPRLLLLDEPTNGLDVEAAEAIKAMLVKLATEEGIAILLTTHQLDVAQAVSDRVAIIRDGEIIVEGDTESLIRRFSPEAFTVKFEGTLNAEQQGALSCLDGVAYDGGSEVVCANADNLYAVIDAVRPNALISVEKGTTDLTNVFLKLVNDKGGAAC